MSLFNIGDWFSGANTGGYQTQAEADAHLAAQKEKGRILIIDRQNQDYYDGIDPATDATLQRDKAAFMGNTESTSAATVAGFQEGLADGVTNVKNAVKNAVTGFGPFKLIPIWVWIVVSVGLFLWLGGGAWIKGILKKRA